MFIVRRIDLIAVLVGAAATLVCAQATQSRQPAPATERAPWPEFVATLAETLVDPAGTDESVARVIYDDVPIRRFDRSEPDDRLTLRDATLGFAVIGTHGYVGVPNTIATDLAMDFRNAVDIPEDVRTQMVPTDEQVKRANITAAQWVNNALQPTAGQPVGLIVLLGPEPETLSDFPAQLSDPRPIIFVLVKAEPGDSRSFRITHIVYGDTSRIVR